MVREIKFRAWDDKENKMIYSTINNTVWVGGKCASINGDRHEQKKTILYEFVMQYTGLKDKNGKEIYEGDIYLWEQPLVKNGRQIYKKHKTVVLFEIPELFYSKNRLENGQNVEVIGNIYENPKLITELSGERDGE